MTGVELVNADERPRDFTIEVVPGWPLVSTGALYFADEDGEEEAIETAEIRFWNIALTAEQANQLGKAVE